MLSGANRKIAGASSLISSIAARHARRAWRAAIELLNDDAPAIFLFAPDNIAAVHRRVADLQIRPDAFWSLVRTWRVPPDRLIDRDRVER